MSNSEPSSDSSVTFDYDAKTALTTSTVDLTEKKNETKNSKKRKTTDSPALNAEETPEENNTKPSRKKVKSSKQVETEIEEKKTKNIQLDENEIKYVTEMYYDALDRKTKGLAYSAHWLQVPAELKKMNVPLANRPEASSDSSSESEIDAKTNGHPLSLSSMVNSNSNLGTQRLDYGMRLAGTYLDYLKKQPSIVPNEILRSSLDEAERVLTELVTLKNNIFEKSKTTDYTQTPQERKKSPEKNKPPRSDSPSSHEEEPENQHPRTMKSRDDVKKPSLLRKGSTVGQKPSLSEASTQELDDDDEEDSIDEEAREEATAEWINSESSEESDDQDDAQEQWDDPDYEESEDDEDDDEENDSGSDLQDFVVSKEEVDREIERIAQKKLQAKQKMLEARCEAMKRIIYEKNKPKPQRNTGWVVPYTNKKFKASPYF